MSASLRSPSRRLLILVTLGCISILGLVFHRHITPHLMGLVQIFVPLQDGTARLADAPGELLPSGGGKVSADTHERVARQRDAYLHQLAALQRRVTELEEENRILTAIRMYDRGGQRIGTAGRLVPARIITGDLLSWRDSSLIPKGSLKGVRRGEPVASDYFSIDRGEVDGISSWQAVLLSETLVGIVEDAATRTARVKLLSDPDSRIKVRLGRFVEGEFAGGELVFWLYGKGRGRMEIHDVDQRDVEAGRVQKGDIVLADPAGGWLPAAMTVGHVTKIEADKQEPLLAILQVESEVPYAQLSRVYVFEADESAGE